MPQKKLFLGTEINPVTKRADSIPYHDIKCHYEWIRATCAVASASVQTCD